MNLINNVLNFFYPNICGICGKIDKKPICNNCKNRINKKIVNGRKVYITTKKRHFDEHMYLFRYKDYIRELMISYKFKGKSYLYKTFAYMILENKKAIKYLEKYDFIICVPIHKKRKKSRGYNQSELIIKDICKINKKFVLESNVLIKTKNVKPQSSLNKEDRIANISNAYKVNKYKADMIKGRSILIFDDIYTTGSTSDECAKLLEEYGAQNIGILTLAKD